MSLILISHVYRLRLEFYCRNRRKLNCPLNGFELIPRLGKVEDKGIWIVDCYFKKARLPTGPMTNEGDMVNSETANSGDKEAGGGGRGRRADCGAALRGGVRVRRQPPARRHHLVQGEATAQADHGQSNYTTLCISRQLVLH